MIRQFFVTNVKAGRCTPGLVCSRTALGQFSARLRRLSGKHAGELRGASLGHDIPSGICPLAIHLNLKMAVVARGIPCGTHARDRLALHYIFTLLHQKLGAVRILSGEAVAMVDLDKFSVRPPCRAARVCRNFHHAVIRRNNGRTVTRRDIRTAVIA